MVLVGDISHGALKEFRESFPSRYLNVGICEPAMMGIAAGLSAMGRTVFVHTIAPFLIERAYEQIKLDFGYQKLPVNLVSVGSTFDYSQLGSSHHAIADASMVSLIPGSKVFIPGSVAEFKQQLLANYSQASINYYRLTENPHGFEFPELSPNGCEERIVFTGHDLTVICLGPTLEVASKVREILLPEISIEVIYVNSLELGNLEVVRDSVSRTKKVLTIEELGPRGGLHDRVMTSLGSVAIEWSAQFCVSDFVHSYGSYDHMLSVAGIDAETIASHIASRFETIGTEPK